MEFSQTGSLHNLYLSQNGMTPLHYAAGQKNLDVCKALCENGASPFVKDKVSIALIRTLCVSS